MDQTRTIERETRKLFEKCDPLGRGFIEQEDLGRLETVLGLTREQLDVIFTHLDENMEGFLTFEAFCNGFGHLNGMENPPEKSSATEQDIEQLRETLRACSSEEMLTNYEQVTRIWKLMKQDNSFLLPEFEKMLMEVANQLQEVKTERKNMEDIVQTKILKQEEHLICLADELEVQFKEESDRLIEKEKESYIKEKEVFSKDIQGDDHLLIDLNNRFEQACEQLEEVKLSLTNSQQEREQLEKEKADLEKQLRDTETASKDCKEYIKSLQKKARMDRKQRARAAIERTENIALERETLVRQLDHLRRTHNKLVKDKEVAPPDQPIKAQPITMTTFTKVSGTVSTLEEHPDQTIAVETIIEPRASVSAEVKQTETTIATARRGSRLDAYFGTIGSTDSFTEPELYDIDEMEEEQAVFKQSLVEEVPEDIQNMNASITSATAPSEIDFSKAQRSFKVTFIGDSGVGKSSIIQLLVTDEFKSTLPATIGVDFYPKSITCDGVDVMLQLWDTAGLEKFLGITRQYYRKADAVVIVWDMTISSGITSVERWLGNVKEYLDEDAVVMVLGNKLDELGESGDQNDGEKLFIDGLLKDLNGLSFRVSASSGHNIQHAFQEMTKYVSFWRID